MCSCHKKRIYFGGVIKAHSFPLFWLLSGRQDIQVWWPLEHSCLTAIRVLAQGQRWVIAIISLHPLSKVSERKSVRKTRRMEEKVFSVQTFSLTDCSTLSPVTAEQMGFTLRGEPRVCLLCWPVAPCLSAWLLPPQITSRRVMKGSSSNWNELPVPMGESVPWQTTWHPQESLFVRL